MDIKPKLKLQLKSNRKLTKTLATAEIVRDADDVDFKHRYANRRAAYATSYYTQ